MTPTELRSTIAALSLTQGGAARLCGVDERTMRRWACGERAIPEPAVRLLSVAEAVPAAGRWLARYSASG